VTSGTEGKRDLNTLRAAKIAKIGKREVKLNGDLKKGSVIVYDQCSEAVTSRLKTIDNWNTIKNDQTLYDLIKAIQMIYVGHADKNQDMYSVVQDNGTSTGNYVRDFKS